MNRVIIRNNQHAQYVAYKRDEAKGGDTPLFLSLPTRDRNVVPLSFTDSVQANRFLNKFRPNRAADEYTVVVHDVWDKHT